MTETTALLQISLDGRESTDNKTSPPSTVSKHIQPLATDNPNSRSYYLGCGLSLAAALMAAFNYVLTQLLDDIVSEFQLNFGMFLSSLGFTLCALVYTKRVPYLEHKANICLMLLFIVSNFLFGICIMLASVHIAVGTLNAVLLVTFVGTTLLFSLCKSLYKKMKCQKIVVALDITTIAIISVGVIFIVQPEEVFNGIKYFNRVNDVYTSLCNSNRFTNSSASNDTIDSVTSMYKAQNWVGYLCAALAGVFNTMAMITGQKFLKDEHLQTMIFWMSVICAGTLVPLTVLTRGFVFPEGMLCFVLLILHAVSGGCIFWLFFAGILYISSIDAAIMSGFVLPVLFTFQFTFLSTRSPTPTNTVAIIAAVVVLVTIVGKPLLQGILAKKGYIK